MRPTPALPHSDAPVASVAATIDDMGLDLDWTMGLLVAVHTGPDLVPPSRWVPLVLGDHVFEDQASAESGMAVMIGLYETAGDQLRRDVTAVLPSADDADAMAAYCGGYLQGARLHDTWTRDDDAVLHLFIFAAIAGEVEDEIHGPDDKPLADPEAWLQARREQVGGYVQELRDYWASRRVVTRSAPKTGRNDPCPCGSGKKHKKCCLT